MERIILEKEILEGQRLPSLYGTAYYNYMRRSIICYPIPLNWLVRWGRQLYYFLADASKREPDIIAAYQRGVEAERLSSQIKVDMAYQQGYNAALTQLEASVQKKDK